MSTKSRRFPYNRSRWQTGMVYAIPLGDSTFCFAQAIVPVMVNVIDIAIFAHRIESLPTTIPPLVRSEIIALGATWRQDLNCGRWASLGVCSPIIEANEFPNQRILQSGGVRTSHSTAGLWEDLLEAWYGLLPWNVMFEEDYFDKKLAPGVSRPSSAVVLSPADRESFRAEMAARRASLVVATKTRQ
jgi:hypothetical protein